MITKITRNKTFLCVLRGLRDLCAAAVGRFSRSQRPAGGGRRTANTASQNAPVTATCTPTAVEPGAGRQREQRHAQVDGAEGRGEAAATIHARITLWPERYRRDDNRNGTHTKATARQRTADQTAASIVPFDHTACAATAPTRKNDATIAAGARSSVVVAAASSGVVAGPRFHLARRHAVQPLHVHCLGVSGDFQLTT